MMSWMFYLKDARGAKLNLVHEGIAVISRPCIHVETKFSDGLSFSSELGVGPRMKKIGYSNPQRWDARDLWWLTPQDEEEARLKAEYWCECQRRGFSKYDLTGALGCAVTGRENPWDPFCSESAYEILPERVKIGCLNYKLHPQRLWELWHVMNRVNTLSR